MCGFLSLSISLSLPPSLTLVSVRWMIGRPLKAMKKACLPKLDEILDSPSFSDHPPALFPCLHVSVTWMSKAARF